jgi:hypothetical protein
MKKIIEKHPVSIFCTANLLTAAMILVITDFAPNGTSQWSPGLYAIITVAVLSGKKGVYSVLKRLSFKRKFWRWYLVAFTIPAVVCTVSYIIFSLIENRETVHVELNHNPYHYHGFTVKWKGISRFRLSYIPR